MKLHGNYKQRSMKYVIITMFKPEQLVVETTLPKAVEVLLHFVQKLEPPFRTQELHKKPHSGSRKQIKQNFDTKRNTFEMHYL